MVAPYSLCRKRPDWSGAYLPGFVGSTSVSVPVGLCRRADLPACPWHHL